jgi:hypothetical protein
MHDDRRRRDCRMDRHQRLCCNAHCGSATGLSDGNAGHADHHGHEHDEADEQDRPLSRDIHGIGGERL